MALIPSDVGIRLRTQTDAPPAPISPLQEIPSDLPQLQAGQAFTARIQQVLPDNTFRALVAGKSITLSLPAGAQAGDVLQLVVVDKSPRLLFARLADGANSNPAAADAAPYPHATFSAAARLISQLLPQEGTPPSPAPLNRGAPLVTPASGEPAPDLAAQLAPKLAQAVSDSGLFYEAHQAQWLMGRLPVEQLRAEPQNQNLPAKQTGSAQATHTAAPSNSPVSGETRGDQGGAAGRPGDAGGTANSLAVIPEALRPLVQQQLDAAASQRLAWHGEVWPNQSMDWEIRRDPEHRSSPEADATPWTTHLSLSMPQLGQIHAQLSLSGKSLNIALTAPAGDPAEALKAHAGELAAALDAVGIQVRGLQVQHESE